MQALAPDKKEITLGTIRTKQDDGHAQMLKERSTMTQSAWDQTMHKCM